MLKTHFDGLLRGVPRRALAWSLGLQAHRCTITARHLISCNKDNKILVDRLARSISYIL